MHEVKRFRLDVFSIHHTFPEPEYLLEDHDHYQALSAPNVIFFLQMPPRIASLHICLSSPKIGFVPYDRAGNSFPLSRRIVLNTISSGPLGSAALRRFPVRSFRCRYGFALYSLEDDIVTIYYLSYILMAQCVCSFARAFYLSCLQFLDHYFLLILIMCLTITVLLLGLGTLLEAQQLLPINIGHHEATFEIQRRHLDYLTDFEPQAQAELVYGHHTSEDSIFVTNITVEAPSGLPIVLMERFDDHTESVDCNGNDGHMSLTYKTEDAFRRAVQAWSYVNNHVDHRFMLIANHDDCSPYHDRQAYIITRIREDPKQLTTHLTSEAMEWKKALRTFNFFCAELEKPKSIRRRREAYNLRMLRKRQSQRNERRQEVSEAPNQSPSSPEILASASTGDTTSQSNDLSPPMDPNINAEYTAVISSPDDPDLTPDFPEELWTPPEDTWPDDIADLTDDSMVAVAETKVGKPQKVASKKPGEFPKQILSRKVFWTTKKDTPVDIVRDKSYVMSFFLLSASFINLTLALGAIMGSAARIAALRATSDLSWLAG